MVFGMVYQSHRQHLSNLRLMGLQGFVKDLRLSLISTHSKHLCLLASMVFWREPWVCGSTTDMQGLRKLPLVRSLTVKLQA
jgi:hypothetical protein